MRMRRKNRRNITRLHHTIDCGMTHGSVIPDIFQTTDESLDFSERILIQLITTK